MRIDIITIFPEMFTSVVEASILKRAQNKGLLEIHLHNLREWTTDTHRTVDDRPYGGGPGMVMKVDILHRAIKDIKEKNPGAPVILMTPQGQPYQQETAEKLATNKGMILISGHYEGYDERVRDYVDQEISIGDYVLTGGELPAMIVIDSVARLIPGVLGHNESAQYESFSEGLLDFSQYTRPEEYEGKRVPEILLSGNHKEIEKWRKEEAVKRTKERRPDLLSD